jgi:gliding motility-associated lipoprotein GldH
MIKTNARTIITVKGKTGDSMIKRINRNPILFLPAFILILSSCNRNVLYTDTVALSNNTWPLMNIPEFRVNITDTLNSNNLFFTLRTGSDYPFRNIYLFVTATSPAGRRLTDTLQYYLADDKGKWYGKGFGDIHELNLPYRSDVYFPAKGEYVFKIQHGMRTENLRGVYDIGLRIEKINK